MGAIRNRRDSSDWLKVLASVALFIKEVRPDLPVSAYYAALVLVLLAIWSKGFFKCFYIFLIGLLGWFAWVSADPVIIAYAAGYFVLGCIYFVEDERRRTGKGQFLSAAWWAGQSSLNIADIRYAAERFEEAEFFTYVFLVIGICMSLKELVAGIRSAWRTRRERMSHL